MRYGILSDVHGNLEALLAVLEHFETLSIDKFLFLGDAVGYGADPNAVCELVRGCVSLAVIGNHDAAVVGRMDFSDYYEAARYALEWSNERLHTENLEWLAGLPYKDREGYIELCHGAPVAPEMFDYLFAPEQLVDLLSEVDSLSPITFIGHSHLTISFRVDPDRVTPIFAPKIECDPAAKYIITAGSVGQPRDRDPRACCGLFDTDTHVFTYYRVEYDIERARQKILEAGLAPIFGDRLLVGM